jgi:CheY-like chemotaxis protein
MGTYRVLVVDNDIAGRRLFRGLEKQAESGACHVRQALSGAAGLRELRTVAFHCILLDFNLPDMTGFDFLTAVCIDGQLPCAVVLLTGQQDDAVAVEAAQRGVHGYLPKDQASTTVLWNTITQAITKAEEERRLAALGGQGSANIVPEQEIVASDAEDAEQDDHSVRPRRRGDFWFEAPPGALAWALQSDGAPYVPASRGRRVLVVDDLVTNRSIIGAFLDNAGHSVTEAEGGEEAVWLASEHAFDVILMDLRMPQVDGLEATRRIRALSDPRGQVPILALTAHSLADQKAKCRGAGMDGHLAKPVDYNTLIRAVDNVIEASVGQGS